MTTQNSLEERIRHFEDVEAIQNLWIRYGHCVDKGWREKVMDYEGLKGVLVDDALWECPLLNIRAVGHAAICDVMKGLDGATDLFMHFFGNPVIEITGDQATGTWLLFVGSKDGGKETITLASYNNDFVRDQEGWRVSAVRLHVAGVLKSQ
jgi:hypothetical protein